MNSSSIDRSWFEWEACMGGELVNGNCIGFFVCFLLFLRRTEKFTMVKLAFMIILRYRGYGSLGITLSGTGRLETSGLSK